MKFLIVDDNKINAKLMSCMIGALGQCDTAESGHDAIAAVKEAWRGWKPYDIILLDIMMPEMNGLEVLCHIRELEGQKNIAEPDRVPIIMVTAASQEKMVRECIREGCDDYIVKPVDNGLFLKRIQMLKAKRRVGKGMLEAGPI